MPASKKGLGRGFESLIPTELLDESFDPTAKQDQQVSELRQIKLDQIVVNPDQPRKQFDQESIEDLAESIAEHGVVQPIIVVPFKGGYQVVAGERRFRASRLAGLDKIPALVRTLSDQHKLEISLIENLQRQDLNVMETATAYLKLRDQFNLSLDDIGRRVGNRSKSSVSNKMRLLKLPPNVREVLANGRLSEGQARPLIGLDKETTDKILPIILRECWPSSKIEQYIVDLKRKRVASILSKPSGDGEKPYADQIKRMQNRLKTEVDIRRNTRGAGKITIRFRNEIEFKRLQKLLSED